jgi:hypothetical protein
MKTYNSKRGLFIGAFIFAFLVFAAGVGMWLFSRNTDNRSQASAMPVASVKIISQKEDKGQLAHTVLFDISQMKKGTTVTDFSAQVFVAKKEFTPPDQATTMPRPSFGPKPSYFPQPSYGSKPTMYPRPSSFLPPPKELQITGAPMPVTNTSVLGVSTSEPVRANPNELPPGALIGPEAEQTPPDALIGPEADQAPATNAPQAGVLAQSKDGSLKVKGLGQFAQLQDLKVIVESSEKGYLITFNAKASAKDTQLQLAFSQPQALFAIGTTQNQAAMLTPVVQKASVRGYLPGMKTVVELTSPDVMRPTASVPTDKPPVVVGKCRSTKDCPKGYTCAQQRVPNCPPGKICKTFTTNMQCTLLPTPTVKKEPSKLPPRFPTVRVSGRPPIIIKTIQ